LIMDFGAVFDVSPSRVATVLVTYRHRTVLVLGSWLDPQPVVYQVCHVYT